jgi:TM2 domain-containing membrane protein YozV
MTDAELERRFLDFVFTTDAIITTGAVAYFTRCTLKESEALLDRLTRQGTLRIENDEQGEIFYVYPNRKRLAAPPHPAPEGEERALVPSGGLGLAELRAKTPRPDAPAQPQQQPVMNIGGGQAAAPLVTMPGPLALDGPNEQVRCPFCAETILAVAKKCKHCGELLDATLRAQALAPVQVNVGVQNVQPAQVARHPAKYVNPGVAALASLVWPGAGQMYAGRIGTGLAWGAFTLAGYLLIVPGLILHVLCMFSAASHARDENRKNGY